DALTKQLTDILTGWKKGAPYERIAEPVLPVKPKRDTLLTPDKENAVYIAAMLFEMRDTDPDYATTVLGNYVLGGIRFTSRMMTRPRQNAAWSCGAGSQLQAD